MKRTAIILSLLILLINAGCSPDTKQKTETAEYTSSKKLSRSDFIFMTSKNGEEIEDDNDMTMPSYNDIILINKNIDENEIRLYLTVRGMPETLTINHESLNSSALEYCWYIGFDSNGDGLIDYNVTFSHDRFRELGKEETEATVDSDAFRTVVLQHKIRSDYTVCEGSFKIDGNTMTFYVEKNNREELKVITEDTPFYVYSESRTDGYYFCDIVPKN